MPPKNQQELQAAMEGKDFTFGADLDYNNVAHATMLDALKTGKFEVAQKLIQSGYEKINVQGRGIQSAIEQGYNQRATNYNGYTSEPVKQENDKAAQKDQIVEKYLACYIATNKDKKPEDITKHVGEVLDTTKLFKSNAASRNQQTADRNAFATKLCTDGVKAANAKPGLLDGIKDVLAAINHLITFEKKKLLTQDIVSTVKASSANKTTNTPPSTQSTGKDQGIG